MRNIILICFFHFLSIGLGFSQFLIEDQFFESGSGANGEVLTTAIQNDGKIIIGGQFTNYNGTTINNLARINPNGTLDQSFNIGWGVNDVVRKIVIQNDNKIIIVGDFTTINNVYKNNIARIFSDGLVDLSYEVNAHSSSGYGIFDCELQDDGKLIIVGGVTDIFGTQVAGIARIQENGFIDNSFLLYDLGGSIINVEIQNDGKILLAGLIYVYNDTLPKKIIRLNNNGDLDLSFNLNIGNITDESFGEYALTCAVQNDNKIIVGGFFNSLNGIAANNLIRLNTDGTNDNTFAIGLSTDSTIFESKILPSGTIILAGSFSSFDNLNCKNLLFLDQYGAIDEQIKYDLNINNSIKTIAIQNENSFYVGGDFTLLNNQSNNKILKLIFSGNVVGRVYLDLNQNCILETNEVGVNSIIVEINPGNYIAEANDFGFYDFDSLPAGTYTATVVQNSNWITSCSISEIFTIFQPDSINIVPYFGLISNNPCPEPTVSIHMPFMRPCFNNQQIYIQACNEYDATDILPDVYSIVELDQDLTFETASIPYTILGNNQFRFEHDTLYPGECVNYTISAQVSCDAILGETLCMEANLYPVADCVLDTIPTPPTGEVSPCTLPWDQSSLSVNGWCANDSIYFTITNTGELGGGDMECYSPIRIFVDGVLMQLDSILLQGGETFTYAFLGTGQTWILQADQHPLHPGNSHPNSHVENCGTGTWTPDLINDLPLDDADPVVDIYCGVVTGSYDPNDKRGFPNGITDEHFIAKNQELEYIIRFQNTGTDTAFTVVVRDTLDENFNIFTVTPSVSSHLYSFRMYGPRVLEWTFANILLPDSTTNEPLSNGFLTFTVKQNPNLAEGTVLKNDADIYFDFNDPIITNETDHKISYQINNIASLEKLKTPKSKLKLYPNPTNSSIIIDLNSFSKSVNYKIYSLSGKLLQEKKNSYGQKFSVDVKNLENGLYFIEVEHDTKIEVLNFIKN